MIPLSKITVIALLWLTKKLVPLFVARLIQLHAAGHTIPSQATAFANGCTQPGGVVPNKV
jgi:hypothetical protein